MLGWLLGFLWLAALKGWLASHVALDADALVVADVWRGLCAGGRLGDWTMGPHPYLFPDLPLYALAGLWARDVPGRQECFGLIQGALLWWFLARLMRRVAGLDAALARAYAAAGLLLLLPFLSATNQLGQALQPGYHGGALLCGLGLLAWCAGQDARPSSVRGVAWASLWVGLVWASDQLTPALAVAPALAFSLGLGGRARRRVWGAAAAACFIRFLALEAWRRQGMRVAVFQWAFLRQLPHGQLRAFALSLGPALESAALPAALGLLALALLASERRGRPMEAGLAAGALLSGLMGFGVALLEGSAQGRYFLGPVWLALPWLPLLLSRRLLDGRPPPLLAAGLLGLLCLGPLGVPAAAPSEAQRARWLDGQLASRGLTRGLADYALARPLRLLSGAGLRVLPVWVVSGGLRPYPWYADRTLFRPAGPVQFVVLNGLDPAAVAASLGKPRGVLTGLGLDVWVYAAPAGAGPGGRKASS